MKLLTLFLLAGAVPLAAQTPPPKGCVYYSCELDEKLAKEAQTPAAQTTPFYGIQQDDRQDSAPQSQACAPGGLCAPSHGHLHTAVGAIVITETGNTDPLCIMPDFTNWRLEGLRIDFDKCIITGIEPPPPVAPKSSSCGQYLPCDPESHCLCLQGDPPSDTGLPFSTLHTPQILDDTAILQPFDVPAVEEWTPWRAMEGKIMKEHCDLFGGRALAGRWRNRWVDGHCEYQVKRSTCADKTRVLLTGEDQRKHCFRLPAKGATWTTSE